MSFEIVLSDDSTGAPTINRNGHDDNSADNYLLDVVGPADLLTSIPQKRHYQRPDH